jgi:hypothetical protein
MCTVVDIHDLSRQVVVVFVGGFSPHTITCKLLTYAMFMQSKMTMLLYVEG